MLLHCGLLPGMHFPHSRHLPLILLCPLNWPHLYETFSDTPTLLRARPHFYALKGPLAGDTSCLVSLCDGAGAWPW